MVGGNKCYYKGKITIDFSPKYQSREDNAKAKYNKVLEDIERKERRSKKIGGPDKFLLSVGNNKKELSEEPPLNTFPTFNKDKKYYTPSFVLPCNRLN